MAFSSDNQYLASSALNGEVRLWNLRSRRLLHRWQGYGSVAISPNSEFIAVNSYGCGIKVWNRKTGKEIYSLQGGKMIGNR
jgi:WD40 repeat protein